MNIEEYKTRSKRSRDMSTKYLNSTTFPSLINVVRQRLTLVQHWLNSLFITSYHLNLLLLATVSQMPFWNQSVPDYNQYSYGQPMTYGYENAAFVREDPISADAESYGDETTHPEIVTRDTIYDPMYGSERYNRDNFVPNSETKREEQLIEDQHPQQDLEETGSQRVQVNNGFQEDFVAGYNSESGHVTSGILLEWKLTFFGTGPESNSDKDDNP